MVQELKATQYSISYVRYIICDTVCAVTVRMDGWKKGVRCVGLNCTVIHGLPFAYHPSTPYALSCHPPPEALTVSGLDETIESLKCVPSNVTNVDRKFDARSRFSCGSHTYP